MKTYKSFEEGVWATPLNYPLTEADSILLNSEDPADDAAKETLKQAITAFYVKDRSEEPELEVISAEVLERLNTLYLAHKPEVTEGETYSLINATIVLKDDIVSGLINWRPVVIAEDGSKTLKTQEQIRF